MKKLLFAAAALLLLCFQGKAQCVPDTNYTNPGFYTLDGDSTLDTATLNIAYTEVITLVTPTTWEVPIIGTVTVDSIFITDVAGLPDNMSASCNIPSCKWAAGEIGCIEILGTPNNPTNAGVNQLTVDMVAKVGTFTYTESIDDFDLIMLDPTSVYEAMARRYAVEVQPNPSVGNPSLVFDSRRSQTVEVRLYNVLGSNVFTRRYHAMEGEQETILEVDHLPRGLYTYSFKANDQSFTGKLILGR